MKIFILSADLSKDSPAWMNIFWPHYNAIAQSVPTVLLSSPDYRDENRTPVDRLKEWRQRAGHRSRLISDVLRQLDPQGPNLLIVWALRRRDIERARLLYSVWDKFSHKALSIVDNMSPEYAVDDIRGRYDLITCFCGDLAVKYEQRTSIPTLYFPPHTDTLTFHCVRPFRPVDLFVVGRRDRDVYPQIHRYFNEDGRDRFSLDFVSRTRNTSYDSEEEFRLLIATYSRSKAAFCFDASHVSRFKGRSPLTERWVHAWTAGCTVIGSTPTGKGTSEQMSWQEATIDLPGEPDTAIEMIEMIEAILEDTEGLERRRLRNAAEAMRRHDTRLRLHWLLTELGLPIPQDLTDGLARLQDAADKLSYSL